MTAGAICCFTLLLAFTHGQYDIDMYLLDATQVFSTPTLAVQLLKHAKQHVTLCNPKATPDSSPVQAPLALVDRLCHCGPHERAKHRGSTQSSTPAQHSTIAQYTAQLAMQAWHHHRLAGDAKVFDAVDGLCFCGTEQDSLYCHCRTSDFVLLLLIKACLPAGHNHCCKRCYKKDGIPPSVAANIIDAADLLLWSLVAGGIRTVRTVVNLHCSICRLGHDCVWGCCAVWYCASNLHSTSISWFAAGECAAVLLLWLLLAHPANRLTQCT
jgi:hypothetical protein